MRPRRLGPRIVLAMVGAVAFSSSTPDASANGRFPKAQVVATVPGSDGATVFLRTTFGILVSRDRGESFRWICERALGYEGQWDPPIAVTRDGRLWVGLEDGLATTTDGCSAARVPELAGETVKDLTTDARGETVWAITGAPGKRSHVFRKKRGAGWERLGEGLDGVNVMTIEVAPSNPSRVYVSGQPYDTIRGRLYRSDDGGRTLSGAANDLAADGPFFIAAIDPTQSDRVILRHLHTKGSDVLVTRDAGKTFRVTLSMESAMFGFAKAPDGSSLWAGSGLPEHGVHRSTDRGEHWERVSSKGVLCLHAPPSPKDALFACENPLSLGAPAVARSLDLGRTWRSLVTFGDVRGPVACGDGPAEAGRDHAEAGAALCGDAAWDEIRAFVVPRSDDADPDAGAPSPSRVLDAGPSPPAAPARRSCGCDVPGGPEGHLDRASFSAGLVALMVWGAARKRPWIRRCPHGDAAGRRRRRSRGMRA